VNKNTNHDGNFLSIYRTYLYMSVLVIIKFDRYSLFIFFPTITFDYIFNENAFKKEK